MKFQFTESNAFLKSTFKSPLFEILDLLKPWTISVASKTFSTSNLSLIKADCVLETIVGVISCSLRAKILEMTLYTTLHKEIGRKSTSLSAPTRFGIKEMKVQFHCFRSFPELKNSSTALVKYGPITSQVFL